MGAHDDLRYLAETLCWMGGTAVWSEDLIAEQLGREGDLRLRTDLRRAASEGLLEARPEGFLLTEAGWALAAKDG